MSGHILYRNRFRSLEEGGDVWLFQCACGVLFGALNERILEECIGDTLDAHRAHVRAVREADGLSDCEEFGFIVLDPARGAALANRAFEVNLRLHQMQNAENAAKSISLDELIRGTVLPSKP